MSYITYKVPPHKQLVACDVVLQTTVIIDPKNENYHQKSL